MDPVLPTDSVPCGVCGAAVVVQSGKEPARCVLCGRVVCRAHTRQQPRGTLEALLPLTCTQCTPGPSASA